MIINTMKDNVINGFMRCNENEVLIDGVSFGEIKEKAYQQGLADGESKGRADERRKIQDILNHRDYDFHKDAEYFSIDAVFEQIAIEKKIKEQKNE